MENPLDCEGQEASSPSASWRRSSSLSSAFGSATQPFDTSIGIMRTLLYSIMPVSRTAKPPRVSRVKSCHRATREKAQMTMMRTESSTMRVVAESSFVTETPAKLKKLIDRTVPKYPIAT